MTLNDVADANRLTIEQWSGDIAAGNVALYEAWLVTLGAPEAVALQILTKTQADMVKQSANVRSGSASSNHTKNMERIEGLIADLVAYMNANIDDIGLTEAGRRLLAGASSGETETTIVVGTFAGNVRRG